MDDLLDRLRESGVDPYPVTVGRTTTLAAIRTAHPDLPPDTMTGEKVGVTATQLTTEWGNNGYGRAAQGNPVSFERMVHSRGYSLDVRELGGEGRRVRIEGLFPPGVYDHEQVVVLPASDLFAEALRRIGAGESVRMAYEIASA